MVRNEHLDILLLDRFIGRWANELNKAARLLDRRNLAPEVGLPDSSQPVLLVISVTIFRDLPYGWIRIPERGCSVSHEPASIKRQIVAKDGVKIMAMPFADRNPADGPLGSRRNVFTLLQSRQM